MIRTIQSIFRTAGIDIHRLRPDPPVALPGSTERKVGDIHFLLEDIRERGFRPRGIIDVGANRGDWTKMALSVFPNAAVIMIEPQTEMVDLLETLCRENSGVIFVNAGAGSEPGELVQTIWEDLAGSSFLPPDDPELREKGRQRLTPVITIESVLAGHPDFHPDLVKLDIQGFELQALAGAASIFGSSEVIILEVSLFEYMKGQPTALEVITFMGERGYCVYDLPGFLRRPLDGALGQMDIAFAKKDGLLRQSNDW